MNFYNFLLVAFSYTTTNPLLLRWKFLTDRLCGGIKFFLHQQHSSTPFIYAFIHGSKINCAPAIYCEIFNIFLALSWSFTPVLGGLAPPRDVLPACTPLQTKPQTQAPKSDPQMPWSDGCSPPALAPPCAASLPPFATPAFRGRRRRLIHLCPSCGWDKQRGCFSLPLFLKVSGPAQPDPGSKNAGAGPGPAAPWTWWSGGEGRSIRRWRFHFLFSWWVILGCFLV